MTKEERHILIGRYFEADTSADDERRLRDELLVLPSLDEEEKETLATMGYASEQPVVRKRFGRVIFQYAAVAGAVIVMAAGLMTAWRMDSLQRRSRCIAFVRGVEITDEPHIMDLISSQLSEMSEMTVEMDSEITGDFEEIRNALKIEDI